MRINCLHCGHKVDLGDAYDDYRGQVKCFVCGGVLLIRTTHGALRSVSGVTRVARGSGKEVLGAAR
jgi:ribosomal protein S27E